LEAAARNAAAGVNKLTEQLAIAGAIFLAIQILGALGGKD
jgi:hypothetical protein